MAKDLRLRAATDMAESSGYTDLAAVELDAIESEQAEVTSLLQVMPDTLKRCNDKYNSLQQGQTAQRPALTDLSEQEEAMSRALATMAFNVMCDHPEAAAEASC